MDSKIEAITIPPISLDFLQKLENAFIEQPIKDDMSLIAIGRQAGRKEVLEFIRRHVRTKTISGNPDDLIRPTRLTFMQKLLHR